MKVCGIIAEYNPFHSGHQYHLQKAKEVSGADYTIIVMSGNFVQRGTPAIANKYIRTEMALRCGADLVLELPTYCAAGSAELFAAGAVNLLNKLGCVTHLCFGSECGDISLLQKAAIILAQEPEEYQIILRKNLREGLSFPAARSAALTEYYPEFPSSVYLLPNNILGIEYGKALYKQNSSIIPLTISRCGSGYHDANLSESISSATAIRTAIEDTKDYTKLSAHIPHQAYSALQNYFSNTPPVFADDISAILHYKLLCEKDYGYSSYMDVSEDISDRIRKQLNRFTTFSAFCDLLKTKEITYSRISRCLLHILLDIKKIDIEDYVKNLDYVPYARILGFQQESAPLFSEIRKQTQIPLVSKLADADKLLTEEALIMLQKDITVSHIYNSILTQKTGRAFTNEYSSPIVII